MGDSSEFRAQGSRTTHTMTPDWTSWLTFSLGGGVYLGIQTPTVSPGASPIIRARSQTNSIPEYPWDIPYNETATPAQYRVPDVPISDE